MERILPAYPLFVKDPIFSIWSTTEELNAQNSENWYAEKKKIYGLLKTKGETYCFMGDSNVFAPFGVKKAEQTTLKITAFSTDYEFLCGATKLKVRFVSPLPLNDLELLSMPVCYVDYEIIGDADAEISLFANRNICYNDKPFTDKQTLGVVMPLDGFESASLGLMRQMPMSTSGDWIGADWGYYYLAGEQAWVLDESEMFGYAANGYTNFVCEGEEMYIGAINKAAKGAILLGYDDRVSIEYFGDFKKGYYLEKHTIVDALTEIWKNRAACEAKLAAIEKELVDRAAVYGDGYKNVLFASLRQSIAAHKLIRDNEGNLVWLSKECSSNGCIGTVDVSYPSMPLYLLYAPELVKGMMRPILHFARTPVWNYDFAPHDAGRYPICNGQLYAAQDKKNKYHAKIEKGGFWGEPRVNFPFYLFPANYDLYDFNRQMPVEECGNMLVMFLAAYEADKDITFFEKNKDLCSKWVQYLVKYGLKPGNQLCTDDFAGHLENNINLAIKATVGIASYARLLTESGDKEEGAKFRKIAEEFAAEISAFAEDKTHLPLTWDSGEETFGLKYNFAFDKILKLGLFSDALFEKEVDYCLSKAERYGVPLDNRKMYTKSDWLMWEARLTDDMEKRKRLIAMLDDFLRTSPNRIAFSDWYETVDGAYHAFKARSVQGGCFILLM